MTMMIAEPGFYRLPEEAYHADPAPQPSLSSSLLREIILRTPLHAAVRHPRLSKVAADLAPSGDRIDIGRVAHRLFLEGDERVVVVVDAPDWRSKEAREQRDAARADGRVALLRAQYERVRVMVDVLREQVGEVLGTFELRPEVSLFWTEDGTWCRARVDGLADGFALDLKTTAIPVRKWADAFWRERRDLQVAWYMRGLEQLGQPVDLFVLIVQETEPPFAAAVFEVDRPSLAFARRDCERGVAIWRRCLGTGVWPGYPPRVHRLEMPEWMERRISDAEVACIAHGDPHEWSISRYMEEGS